LCYLDLQQYALAEQSFRAALRADPEEADALLGLAEAARYQGKKAEATRHYERYLALHPDGEEAVAARNAINQLKE
jgi:Tfp pilus assembly protein PilF